MKLLDHRGDRSLELIHRVVVLGLAGRRLQEGREDGGEASLGSCHHLCLDKGGVGTLSSEQRDSCEMLGGSWIRLVRADRVSCLAEREIEASCNVSSAARC